MSFFQGNFYFSSFNQLDVKSTSRRDDLHSLIYMLVYMLNRGTIPCIQEALRSNPGNLKKRLAEVRASKKSNTLSSMCVGRAQALERLSDEISKLGFEDKPNYAKMRVILQDLVNGAQCSVKARGIYSPQDSISPKTRSLHTRNIEIKRHLLH